MLPCQWQERVDHSLLCIHTNLFLLRKLHEIKKRQFMYFSTRRLKKFCILTKLRTFGILLISNWCPCSIAQLIAPPWLKRILYNQTTFALQKITIKIARQHPLSKKNRKWYQHYWAAWFFFVSFRGIGFVRKKRALFLFCYSTLPPHHNWLT